MKKLAALTLSLFLGTGMALADTPKNSDAQPAKAPAPAKPKAGKKAEKSDTAIAAEIEELRQAIQSQQEQLQLLKEELAKRDRQIDEAREAAAAANARAAEARSKAVEAVNSSAEVKSTTATLNTTVSDLKASNEALKTTVASEQAEAKKAEEMGPSTIKYKGVNITPGGFVEAATVFRNRATSADINTPFNSIPYPGNSLSKVTENNFTARQSRLTLLGESNVGSAKLTGYFEMDFLGAGTTSNNRQSNSYVFRQRQIWGQVALENGLSVTGGQMWSLATENRKGIQNRGEALPMMVDPQYVVGFTWQRAYALRVVKDFGGKFAVGLSIEGPQATFGGRGFSTVTQANLSTQQNFFINAPGAGGGLYNAFDATGYTVNKAPDFIFKLAADPGFGHYELFGIVSTFRNRIYPCAIVSPAASTATVILNGPALTGTTPGVTCPNTSSTAANAAFGAFNDTRTGGGGGASAHWALFNKKVDFGVKGVAGDGIGRFGSAQLPDLTFRPDGTEALIRTAHGLGILELHPDPKLDIFLYYGGEYAWRAGYTGYSTDNITTSQTYTTTPCVVGPGCPTGFQTTATTITTHTTANNKIGGYGHIAANDSGCSTEGVPAGSSAPSGGGTCAGDTRFIQEGTLGFWHKFYQGPRGAMRWGITYSYITRTAWSGAGSITPKANDNIVWTSFRYYLP
ncbi:MAG TPA: hypothetical protein VNB49_10165 [Candidatus Dormibacteraeota bacterium]|nr:hypothetical protein [Candidatus Dormibacteraeota bacterium]